MKTDLQTQTNAKDLVYKTIFKITGKSAEEIKPSDKLENLVADSIQLFEFVLELEETFPTPPDYEKLIDIKTVEEAIEFVDKNYIQKS